MPSRQLTAVTKNLNSMSKNWAFTGEVAELGHLFGMEAIRPGKNFKFKEIHVVVPKNQLGLFHFALYKKGYLLNTANPSLNILRFKHPIQKRPVVLFVKNKMPRTTSYKSGERLVALSETSNKSKNLRRVKTFVKSILNTQPNIN
jgi:hypothetical protein